MVKVCHVTSAHDPEDVRIFQKECISLANHGYEVSQIVKGDSYIKDKVKIVGFGRASGNRYTRMTKTAHLVYQKAVEIDADIYHLHDPELMIYAGKLKKLGKKVIFDSHEDIPAQIMDKHWIPKPLRKLVSVIYQKYETSVARNIDAVVAATPYIAARFENRSPRVVIVNNFPKLDDILFHDDPFSHREAVACYAGGLSLIRGEKVMCEASKEMEGQLILAGKKTLDGSEAAFKNVRYVGSLNRNGINELYGSSIVGLVVLMPTGNYINSQPIKMYEYMAAGLPFVCSNFDMWREVVNKTEAGICVDPYDTHAIASAVNYFFNNREEAQQMGLKGRKAVENVYNWGVEEAKLLDLYKVVAKGDI